MTWKKVEQDVESGPFGLLKWIVIAVIILFVLFGTLRAIGLIGGKVVERQVLKHSFQYKEGMAQRGTILEANLAEIDAMIQQHPEKRDELLAQRKVIQAQLRAITINN